MEVLGCEEPATKPAREALRLIPASTNPKQITPFLDCTIEFAPAMLHTTFSFCITSSILGTFGPIRENPMSLEAKHVENGGMGVTFGMPPPSAWVNASLTAL